MTKTNEQGLKSKLNSAYLSMVKDASGGSFLAFAHLVNPLYRSNWHHRLIIRRIERFLKSKKAERLMLFMPPQHGKSEIASRLGPAFALGLDPDLAIAACSYSADLSSKFNRDVQRIMDAPAYQLAFSETSLNDHRVSADSKGAYLRNTKEFEIVGHRGSYKSVGLGGGLSGRKVDLAIIDDPVKDAMQAYSETYRENAWDWYLSVLKARLHNRSKQLVIMTRWHQDDLAGRILKHEKDKWEVISIPAICEELGNEWDPRKIGEPLWPQRHSLERLQETERLNATWFAALYQQRPTPKGGGLIKPEWFGTFYTMEMPPGPVHFYVDPAYTEKQQNDPTAVMAYKVYRGKIYILNVATVRKGFHELTTWLKAYCEAVGYTPLSKILIEPKASGISIVQSMQANTDLNVNYAPTPVGDKIARVSAQAPIYQAGRVLVIHSESAWKSHFFQECEAFPMGAHDDRVDCLEGAVRCDLVLGEVASPTKSN